jgi:hypothetical protein
MKIVLKRADQACSGVANSLAVHGADKGLPGSAAISSAVVGSAYDRAATNASARQTAAIRIDDDRNLMGAAG